MYIVCVKYELCTNTHTYTHTHTHTHTHTTYTHAHRRTLEKEAATVVKTAGEPTKHINSGSRKTLAPPTENGSLRSMKSSSEASSSSSTTSSTMEMRTHPRQEVRRSEGVASSPSPPPVVDIKALINQVGKDVRRTDKSHPYYKGENNVNTKTLM